MRLSPARSRGRQTRKSAATIREVARAAGVSVATVSRALNDKGPIRPETRRRVGRAIEKLRYVPHGAARSLITRRTHTLGVLLPDIFGEFFSELIRGIDLAARTRGYHVLVSGFHGHPSETRAMLRAMRGRVDGLIVLSAGLRTEDLDRNVPGDLPVVLLNDEGSGHYDSICVDNYGGAFALARHVIARGHRNFGVVMGPAGNRDAAERLRGYHDGLGRTIARQAVRIRGDFREEAGYRAAARILAAKRRPSAVLAANDAMAIGLLCAFREQGILVPEDIALVGFDDIPIARFVTPPLTTVRVPILELGSRATARLLRTFESSGRPPIRRETLPTTLVVRASCGVPLRSVQIGLRARLPETIQTKATRDSELPEEGAR